jgi:hypothetical protein
VGYINSDEHEGRSNMTSGKDTGATFKKDNNTDNMVVPPFGLPNDKNTFSPDDISSYRGARSGLVSGS